MSRYLEIPDNLVMLDKLKIWYLRLLDKLYKRGAGRPLLYNIYEQTSPHYARFPDPPRNHKNQVQVNYLGKRYYAGSYPRWVMWNYEKPEYLYINVDFLIAAFKHIVINHSDKLVKAVVIALATEYVANKMVVDRGNDKPDKSKVLLYFKGEDNKNLDVDYNFWVTPELIKKFEDS